MFLLLQVQLNVKAKMERLKVFWEFMETAGHSTHCICIFLVLFRLEDQIFFMNQDLAVLEEILLSGE